MEIYFIDDKLRIIVQTERAVRFRTNVENYTVGEDIFKTADALSYKEVIETLRARSNAAMLRGDGTLTALENATYEYYLEIFDTDRGDAFTMFMMPFEKWCTVLDTDQYTTPEIYK